MALWPVAASAQLVTTGATATSLSYVAVAAPATPHTMGSWVTLVSSTPFNVDGFTFSSYLTTGVSAADTSQLMDIGVGGAGSEQVLVTGIPTGGSPATAGQSVYLPLRIPAGTRIAARIQSAVASAQGPRPGLVLTSASSGWRLPVGGSVSDSYGVVAASSCGTALADVGSANTKAAWTEITSTTTHRYRFLLPLVTLPGGDNNIVGASYLYDVGIGSSGNEVAIIPNVGVTFTSAEVIVQPTLQPFPCNIPAGTRLSARMQKSGSTAEPLSMVIIGID